MWTAFFTLILFILTIVLYRIQLNKILRVFYDTCEKLELKNNRSEDELQDLIKELDVRVKNLEDNSTQE